MQKALAMVALMIGILSTQVLYALSVKITQPSYRPIQKSFSEPAETHLAHIYHINMPFSGKLERIALREGDHVQKDQIVAQLAQKPLQETVNRTRATLNSYIAELALQNKTVQRQKALRQKGFTDAAALDAAYAQQKIIQTKINQAKAELAIAQYNLKESSMHAPINGTILDRYTQGGKWLTTGEPILRIGDLTQLEVICDVLTQDAHQLKIGDAVLLKHMGTTTVYQGTVEQIYPAGFTKKSSLGVDEQRVNVIIHFKQLPPKNLGLGYRLQAEFFIGTQEQQALVIPRYSILQNKQGDYYVLLWQNKKPHKRVVTLGTVTDQYVSVTKGLTAKDHIVAEPTADM